MGNNSKKTIVIIPSWYPPEGGKIFEDFAHSFDPELFNVTVLVNRIIGIRSHKLHEILGAGRSQEIKEDSVSVTRTSILKLPWQEKLNTRRWIGKTVRLFDKYIRIHPRPDLIIAMSAIWAGVVAEKLKKKYSIPYIIIEHRGRFTMQNEFAGSFFKSWYSNYFVPAFESADRIISVSEALRSGISKMTAIPSGRINVIPNFVDSEFFAFPVYKRESQPFIFLAVGMLEKVKGYEIILHAFSEFVDATDGEFFLRIGGRGSEERALKILARELGISDRLGFIGQISRERVRDEMQRANVLISASYFESFGLVMAEAAMTGLPVIASRSGGAESIVHEGNGILVETGDPSALMKAMEKMVLEYPAYDQESIRREAVEKYSRHVIIAEYNKLITDILNEK